MGRGRGRAPRRRVLTALLAIGFISCDLLPAGRPTGTLGEIAQSAATALAPGAELIDSHFEEFVAQLDLRKAFGSRADEIIDQLRRSRAAVAAQRKPASAAGGGRLASLLAVTGVFIVPLFGQTLADALDPLTKAAGTRESKPNPYSNTESGATTTTTTTLNITEVLSSSGSKVTLTVHWNYRMTTKDTASGATLIDARDARTMVGTIDVCPDASGSVPGTLDVQSTSTGVSNGATSTRVSTSSNGFAGTVDDSASLRKVTQKFEEKTSWETTSGAGGYDSNISATYAANESGFAGGLDTRGFSGSFNATGEAASNMGKVSKATGWALALDALALDGAYAKAQRLWRNGRCVMVTAPDYSAETPLEVSEQEKQQHDEEVDVDSETKFSVNLKHRFGGGALNSSISAELTSGEKKLEPNKLSGSGSLTYKAPAEPDKKATAQHKSTSKRGIGTLVLAFHTVGQNLMLTITGTLTATAGLGVVATVRVSDTVTVGPLEFKKRFENVYETRGTWQARLSSVVTIPGVATQTCTGSESGTIIWEARVETRGGKKVWVLNGLEANAEGSGSDSCGDQSPQSFGDSGGIFVATLGEIVIPAEGGRLPLRRTTDSVTGKFTAEATIVATTKKQ